MYMYRVYRVYIVYIVYIYVHIYMAVNQNCVWNFPRCSRRMDGRGFVTGLVPDLWNVMKYRLYKNNKHNIYIYVYCIYVMYIINISLYAC